MMLSRCLVLAVAVGIAVSAVAQPPASAPNRAQPFAGDERAAKLADRYRAMLAANPAEGIALDRLWKAYEERGATAVLIDEYRAEAEGSASAAPWLVYGHLLKKAGRLDDAATAYGHADKQDPGSPLALLAQGELALARRQPETAAPLLAEALAKLPPDDRRRADWLMKLGAAWLAAGKPALAAESWEQIVSADPSNLALHQLLAETCGRNGLTEKALAHYDYIDRHANATVRAVALREAGRLHENRGEFDAARDAFERGLALTSRDNWLRGELQAALIRLYQRAGRAPELQARWRREAELAPRDLGGLLRLEALAEAEGDMPTEREWLEKVTTLAPRDRDSRRKLARLLAGAGQRVEAAAHYDLLLKDQPDSQELLLARADLDLQLADSDAAVRRLEQRLARSPTDESVAAPIIEFFLKNHLDEPAERILRAAVLRQPDALEPGIALSRFYFARHRLDDARQLLDALASQPASVVGRADRWQRLAAMCRDENFLDDALRCWREAEKLAPSSLSPKVAAGEILLAQGDAAAAANALQAAVGLVPAGPEREEIERKLFQALSANSGAISLAVGAEKLGAALPDQKHPPNTGPTAALAGHGAPSAAAGNLLELQLASLEDEATRHPTPAAFVRLARWQMWSRSPGKAVKAAERAVALDPGNIPARQLLVSLWTDARHHDFALQRLDELVALDPTRKPAYLRQIADLQMERGEFDAALAGYSNLAESQPGALEPLTYLALAQQRADRWFDALASWRRAYAMSSLTPAQRSAVRRPLVLAYEHLGEFRPAADLLRAAVDDQPDLARKQEVFHDLNEFCARHSLADWLSAQYEARLVAWPDDYFTLVAVAELRKGQGQQLESYQLLARAFYSAPDPSAALKTLSEEAEAIGDDDQAAIQRQRLVSLDGQATAENLEKLASAQEESADEAGAARTWDLVAARFPRDTAVLGLAAAFFERIGQEKRARSLLTQSVTIDPTDLGRFFHLGELERDAGDVEAARARLEAVLAHSDPGDISAPLKLPPELVAAAATAMRSSGRSARGWPTFNPAQAHAEGDEARPLRLRAIRELAKLLPAAEASAPPRSGGADLRARWRTRWLSAAAAGARSEALEALFSSGEAGTVMESLSGWLSKEPSDEPLRGAFLLAGLRLGDYRRLADWAWADDRNTGRGLRGPLLMEALQQFLATGGQPGDGMISELFPPQVRARDLLWKAAGAFAEHRWHAQAAELGERVLALASTGRQVYAVELAQWEFFLGRADRAQALLRDAVEEGGGVSFDSPAMAALRAYYLLLPDVDRPAFVVAYLSQWQGRGEPLHGALSAVLLHGLQGDELAARHSLDGLLAMGTLRQEPSSDSPDVRRWNDLLLNGEQLQKWNLSPLAVYLWRGALRESPAFDRQNADLQGTLVDLQSRLASLEVATAGNPEQARERVATYLRGDPPPGQVSSLANQFAAGSQLASARQLFEHLTVQEPGDGDHWRNLLSVCNAMGDTDAVERILTSLLGESLSLPPTLNRAELVRRLAGLQQDGGDPAGARRILERALANGNRSSPVVTTLALDYENAGAFEDATRVWREGLGADPVNATNYRLALARLEERRGNLPGAITLLEAEVAAKTAVNLQEPLVRLASLLLRTGRPEEAKRLALDALRANDLGTLTAIARVFAQTGQPATAREWLVSATRRAREPQTRFLLQRELLQAPFTPADEPLPAFERELRRLKKFAQAAPALRAAYDTARNELARQHHADSWLERELKQEWRNGTGEFSAGEQLVGFYVDTRQPDRLRQVMQAIDRTPDLPEQSLSVLPDRLDAAGFAALALPVAEGLYRRFPHNVRYAFVLARTLWKAGRADGARQLLGALELNSVFLKDVSAQLAGLYQELGDSSRARELFAKTARREPTAERSWLVYLQSARLEAESKNWPEVRRLLLVASRQPAACADLRPWVDYLADSGRLASGFASRLPGDEFLLSFSGRAQLNALIYGRLKSEGRTAEAQRFVAAYPGFLAGSPSLAAAARADADAAQIPPLSAALEEALALTMPPQPRLCRDLAAIYVRWSDQEANGGSLTIATRLAHLTRANQLVPDDFDAARRLAALCWDSGQPAQAARALQPFLAADAVPAEREQARQLLARR